MRESTKLLLHAFGILAYPLLILLLVGAAIIDAGMHAGLLPALFLASVFLTGMHVGVHLHTAPDESKKLMDAALEAEKREDD